MNQTSPRLRQTHKKSLILSAILLGALLTPQRTNTEPGSFIAFCTATAYVGAYTITFYAQTFKVLLSPFQKNQKKKINYIKNPKLANYYCAEIKIYTKKDTLYKAHIKENNFESFLNKIQEHAKNFEKKRKTTISIKINVQTSSGAIDSLQNIVITKYSIKYLQRKIKNQLQGKTPSSKASIFLIIGVIPYLILVGPVTITWMIIGATP